MISLVGLVKQVDEHVEPMSEPHVSSDIPVKPVHVRPIKIAIPLDIFQQHVPETFFQPEVGEMEIDETFARIRIQNLCIVGWTFTEEEQLTKINLDYEENLQ